MRWQQKISHYWRILATGSCFICFGGGAFILSYIVIPILFVAIRDKNVRELKVQEFISYSFKFFCKLMQVTQAISYEFVGFEKLGALDKSTVIVANHPSLIDYVLIVSKLEHCDCLVKESLWENLFIGPIIRAAGYIPNTNSNELFNKAQVNLAQGRSLLIFPEGTRTTPNTYSKLQRGAAQIALRTNTNISVVHIGLTAPFLTKEMSWYQVPLYKPHFKVEYCKEVEVFNFIDQSASIAKAARHLTDELTHKLFLT